jgi:hypothetical protein
MAARGRRGSSGRVVAIFSNEQLQVLEESYATLHARYIALAGSYRAFAFRTECAQEFAIGGFLRRVDTMHHCIARVFELIPPDRDITPDKPTLMDATVGIQAFVTNVFGAIDNLAWIWVKEKRLKVDQRWVGLVPKCKTVRGTFSPEMQGYLDRLAPWFEYVIDYRDALAHRIPLYIAPYMVPDETAAAYQALEAQSLAARDASEHQRLKEEQLKLGAFQPVMLHTLQNDKGAVGFHFQLLADFATVETIAHKMLEELRRLN